MSDVGQCGDCKRENVELGWALICRSCWAAHLKRCYNGGCGEWLDGEVGCGDIDASETLILCEGCHRDA